MPEYQRFQSVDNLREWVARARAVRLEDELARRGIPLTPGQVHRHGACPRCGDSFSINISRQHWECRGCQRGGDVAALVAHLDRTNYIGACRALTGYAPQGHAKNTSGVSAHKPNT